MLPANRARDKIVFSWDGQVCFLPLDEYWLSSYSFSYFPLLKLYANLVYRVTIYLFMAFPRHLVVVHGVTYCSDTFFFLPFALFEAG